MIKTFAMKALSLTFIFVGVVAAQSAPPRKDIPAIAKAANGAIVTIIMAANDKPIAQGTGFLVSTDGVIVTNYHVIETGNVAVVKFPDDTTFPVDGVLATDKVRDLAIIKIHGKTFRTLSLGDSNDIQVGEEVVAIGNPLSLESTVSNGIISGVRTSKEQGGKFLQTTAPISPGSSGGPLFNMRGEVVGINTLYLEGGENLNFAIPANDAKLLLSHQSAKLQNLPNEMDPKEISKRSPKESPQDAPRTINDLAQWMTNSIRDNDNPTHYNDDNSTHRGEVTQISGSFRNDCYVLTQETIVEVPAYEMRYKSIDFWVQLSQDENFFNLRDIDPNTVLLRKTPLGTYEFIAKTTNNERKIRHKCKTDFEESRKDYARISEVKTDSVSFQLDSDYGPRFTKAFKQAVIVCGGRPSIF